MPPFATIDDITALFRPLTVAEQNRAAALLPIVSDALRQEAINRNRNLDKMIECGQVLESVVKSVVVDITARTLMTSTNQEPVSQMTQAGGGYSVTGTFLSPGGGMFIKETELRRLGISKQSIGLVRMNGMDQRHNCDFV